MSLIKIKPLTVFCKKNILNSIPKILKLQMNKIVLIGTMSTPHEN